jgi:hypothetical protein
MVDAIETMVCHYEYRLLKPDDTKRFHNKKNAFKISFDLDKSVGQPKNPVRPERSKLHVRGKALSKKQSLFEALFVFLSVCKSFILKIQKTVC